MERASREPGPTTAVSPDDGFRSFVAAIAEPLTRLAFVLTIGVPGQLDAGVLAANALAQVRRQWREVEAAGLPEQLAVDALLSVVLKRRVRWPARSASNDTLALPLDDAVLPTGAVSLAATESSSGVDREVMRDVSWRAFLRLAPRQRAAIVFADPSVVAARLAGLDVPPLLGSLRRHDAVLTSAVNGLRIPLRADTALTGHPPTLAAFDACADEQLVVLLGEAIRAHAPSAPPVFDPTTQVRMRVRQLRRRALLAAGLVVVLIAAAGVFAVIASSPTATTARAKAATSAAAASSASAATPSGAAPASPPGFPADGVPPGFPANGVPPGFPADGVPPGFPAGGVPPLLGPIGAQPSTDPDEPVVPWPVRGGLADDVVLLARVEAAFMQAHPDATSRPQVLLAADTPAFRIAYVTAKTPNGVMESWFSAPTGSPNLLESTFTYSDALGPTSVVAVSLHQVHAPRLSAGSSRSELIVIAPPTASSIQTAGVDQGVDETTSPAPFSDGIAIKALAADDASSTSVQVGLGPGNYYLAGIEEIGLDPGQSYATGDATTQRALAQPGVSVERGRPDPGLLSEALLVTRAWEGSDLTAAGTPVVLWGGTDAVGTKLVVTRVRANHSDLLILEWSGDAPGLHGELLVNSTSPETPVAFAYRSTRGTRIGVIATSEYKAAALQFKGRQSPAVVFDDSGFASIPLSGPGGLPSDVNVNASPPPSNEFSGLIDATVQVALTGFSDEPRGVLSVPPAL